MSAQPGVVDEPAVDEPVDGPARRDAGPRSLPPKVRVRRAVTLLLLTLLVPGSAQLTAGNRRLGRLAVRCWALTLGLLALTGLIGLLDRRVALSFATSPLVLIAAALACYAAAVAWPLLVVDAWRLGRPALLPRRTRPRTGALALVLVLVTCLTPLAAGRRLWAGADLINGVFGSGRASAAVDGRFNVLLLGGDAGPDRVGTRPDSMTVASIDVDTGRTVLFSLPRNLEDIPFPRGSRAATALPDGWSCGDQCLLNGIYTWGAAHRDLYPGVADPGAEAMKEAAEGVTGLRVNYYVLIDLKGFRDLVDALGGVELTVRHPVPIGGGTSRVSGYIQPGTQRLDGYHALWYARSRHGANDYERMARQRCVMDAMVHQLAPATVLAKFQGIATAGRNVVSTDIPGSELSTFLDLAAKARGQRIRSVQFVPPVINPARPDISLVHEKVSQALAASRTDTSKPSTVPASSPSVAAAVTRTPVPSKSGRVLASPGAGTSVTSPVPPPAEASDISAVCSPA